MAGRLRPIAGAGLIFLGAPVGHSAETATPAPSATPSISSSPAEKSDTDKSNPRHVEGFQDFIKQLPPEQRDRFQQNLDLWNTLTPEERKNLRSRYDERRKRIKNEIDDSIKVTGLNLDEPTKKAFADRYFDERRKIEQSLRGEMDVKRRAMTKDLLEKLRGEFASRALPPTPTPSATATASPTASATPAVK